MVHNGHKTPEPPLMLLKFKLTIPGTLPAWEEEEGQLTTALELVPQSAVRWRSPAEHESSDENQDCSHSGCSWGLDGCPLSHNFSLIKGQWMRKQQQMSVMVQLILDPTGHAGGTPILV